MDGTEKHSLRQLKKMFKRALYYQNNPLSTIRVEYDNFFYFPHIPNNADIQTVTVGNIPIDIIRPELAASGRAILYAHGGAFVSGSRKAARNLCVSLAHEARTTLFLPEYRLAPEYPFPAGLDDVYTVYNQMQTVHNLHPNRIIFSGDGAGAGLVTALIHRLINEKKALPAALVLLSPWADITCSGEEMTSLKKKDIFLTKESLLASAGRYTPQDNWTNPLVSPLYGNFEHFPPVYIQCGGQEILLSDAKRLADRIEKAGGSVVLDVWHTMWHLFQAMEAQSDEAHSAVEKVGTWMQLHLKTKH